MGVGKHGGCAPPHHGVCGVDAVGMWVGHTGGCDTLKRFHDPLMDH